MSAVQPQRTVVLPVGHPISPWFVLPPPGGVALNSMCDTHDGRGSRNGYRHGAPPVILVCNPQHRTGCVKMSWCLVIAVLLGGPMVAPCCGAVYGGSARPSYGMSRGEDSGSGAIRRYSAASGASAMAGGDHAGGAEALRRFASTRAMKTGTTIAGVVFEVCAALRCIPTSLFLEREQSTRCETLVMGHLFELRRQQYQRRQCSYLPDPPPPVIRHPTLLPTPVTIARGVDTATGRKITPP